MTFQRSRLSFTPCKLPSNSIEPFLNETDPDYPKALRQKFSSNTRHQPKVIGILGRIFTKSSSEKSIKSSGGPWGILDLRSDEADLPPAYVDHSDFQFRQSNCPSPASHLANECALPDLPDNQLSCRSRVESQTIDAISHRSLLPPPTSSVRSNATSPLSNEECPIKRPSRRSSSHSVSASRRARQARRDLNAAKKSLPVLEKYARSATAQRR